MVRVFMYNKTSHIDKELKNEKDYFISSVD